MNSITPTKPEHANYVNHSVRPVLLHLVSALHVMPPKTESLELITMDNKLVSVNQDTTQLLMVHVFNPTVTPIPSAPNANKDLNSVFNVLPPSIESSNFQKVPVSACLDITQMLTILVFLVLLAVVSVHQLLNAFHVFLCLLPMVMDLAAVLLKLISLSHLMELDIALNVELIVLLVLMSILAPHARLHTPKQLITNVSAQPETMLLLMETVYLAPMDVKNVQQPITVQAVSVLFFFKEQFVNLDVMIALLPLDLSVLDVQKVVKDVLKIRSAITVEMVSSCIKEIATMFAQLELLVINPLEAGYVLLAINHAKHA